LDFKSRGRLGRVERATEGMGISLKGKGALRFCKSSMAATINRHFGTRVPLENACIAGEMKTDEQYFHVVLFITLYKESLAFESGKSHRV